MRLMRFPIAPMADPGAALDLSRAALVRMGSVFDLAPMVLALLDVPVGRDMQGEVLESILREPLRNGPRREPVPTHDTPSFLAERPGPPPVRPDEAERIEQLRELGYIRDRN